MSRFIITPNRARAVRRWIVLSDACRRCAFINMPSPYDAKFCAEALDLQFRRTRRQRGGNDQ